MPRKPSAAVAARADEIAAERREALYREAESRRLHSAPRVPRQVALAEQARRIVEAAPPLSVEQRSKLAAVLHCSLDASQEKRIARREADEQTAREQLRAERQARSIKQTLSRYAAGGVIT